jgi:hypothetical protein
VAPIDLLQIVHYDVRAPASTRWDLIPYWARTAADDFAIARRRSAWRSTGGPKVAMHWPGWNPIIATAFAIS